MSKGEEWWEGVDVASNALYEYDRALGEAPHTVLVGLDEAGRGPLAGPVVAAAVMLDSSQPIQGVDDSKRLTAKKREALYEVITREARAWAIGIAEPQEIDRHNILQASLTAMLRALGKIPDTWTLALVDGNCPLPNLEASRQRCVVGGDGLSASIAAASILAKVTRDRFMQQYHSQFPVYDFAAHKGYATARHRELILRHGLCAIHRRTFCEKLVMQTRLAFDDTSAMEHGI